MTKIIYLNTHQRMGAYLIPEDRIEISSHFPERLKEYVLKHELKHAALYLKYGLKSLPLHIAVDYKTCFSTFANPELISDLKEFNRKSGKLSKWGWMFESIYYLSQTLNVFFCLAGCVVGFFRNRKVKDKLIDLCKFVVE